MVWPVLILDGLTSLNLGWFDQSESWMVWPDLILDNLTSLNLGWFDQLCKNTIKLLFLFHLCMTLVRILLYVCSLFYRHLRIHYQRFAFRFASLFCFSFSSLHEICPDMIVGLFLFFIFAWHLRIHHHRFAFLFHLCMTPDHILP